MKSLQVPILLTDSKYFGELKSGQAGKKIKSKVHPCTGTEAVQAVRPIGEVEV